MNHACLNSVRAFPHVVAIICASLALAIASADEIVLDSGDAEIHGNGARYGWHSNELAIGYWKDAGTWVSWELEVSQAGRVGVAIVQAATPDAAGSGFLIEAGAANLTGTVRATKGWRDFERIELGEAELPNGRCTIAFKPTSKSNESGIINLRSVVLRAEGISIAPIASGPGEKGEPGERISNRLVRFRPQGVSAEQLPPSMAFEGTVAATGPVSADWKLAPTFGVSTANPARWLAHGKVERRFAHLATEAGTSLYGTGEAAGRLLRNGRRTICWNSDNFAYNERSSSLYQSHPWVLGVRADGSAFGVLADTTYKCEIDLTDGVRFTADGPSFAVFVFDGESPQDVVRELAAVTGKMPLPPLWALGYQQCRFSYFPESRVLDVAGQFRMRSIPADVIWLDIDYMDKFKVFTFDREKFPDPKRLNDALHADGFKAVWMIDPGVGVEQGYNVYDSGSAGDHWVKTADGKEFHGKVWPGPCAFPDFTRPETRAWWAGLYRDFMAQGVDGVWNDMNEPAVFESPNMTMPLDNVHRGGGGLPAGTHAQYHNVYGRLMVEATRAGIQAANPDKRPFVLTRANFIGGQRFAATWTGDNASTWEHLGYSIPMALNLGLSGQPFCGPDIGGFEGDGDGEMFAQWMGIGALLPFSRGHSTKGSRDKEPWAWGKEVEDSCRISLERRYRLLPYLYTLFREASVSGLPVMRPLFFADPKDPDLRGVDTSFLLGDDLLVEARVTREKSPAAPRPKGVWRELTMIDERREDADPHQPKLLIRGGAIIPLGRVVLNTTERLLEPLTLLVCLDEAGRARGELYEDAGEGYGYRDGQFLLTRYEAKRGEDGVEVKISAAQGQMARPKRELRIELICPDGVKRAAGDEMRGVTVR